MDEQSIERVERLERALQRITERQAAHHEIVEPQNLRARCFVIPGWSLRRALQALKVSSGSER